MSRVYFETTGSFTKTQEYLSRLLKFDPIKYLEKYAQRGVNALSAATPYETGATARGWGYEIHKTKTGWVIYWTNSNINHGVPIAVLIQYGHGTRNGGYVSGRDYINPALRPVFDQIAADVWNEVTNGND